MERGGSGEGMMGTTLVVVRGDGGCSGAGVELL